MVLLVCSDSSLRAILWFDCDFDCLRVCLGLMRLVFVVYCLLVGLVVAFAGGGFCFVLLFVTIALWFVGLFFMVSCSLVFGWFSGFALDLVFCF